MTATNAERAKAVRIRKKIANGKASDRDIVWINNYEKAFPPDAPKQQAPRENIQTEAITEQETETSVETINEQTIESDPNDDEAEIESEPETSIPDTSFHSKCQIKDCPACAAAEGRDAGQVCGTTGEVVYPPISDETARIFALVFLIVIGIFISLKTKKEPVPPNDNEAKLLAKPIKNLAYKHMNSLGKNDDLMQLIAFSGAYTVRALRESK